MNNLPSIKHPKVFAPVWVMGGNCDSGLLESFEQPVKRASSNTVIRFFILNCFKVIIIYCLKQTIIGLRIYSSIKLVLIVKHEWGLGKLSHQLYKKV
jgi:hypothetical protein